MVGRIKQIIQHWIKVDGPILSAAVTFYAALALFPVLIVLLSVFGWMLGSSQLVQDWETQILDLVEEQTSQEFASTVSSQLSFIEKNTKVTGLIGILSLFAFSMAFFSHLEKAFSRIWQLPKPRFGIWVKLRQFLFDRIRAYFMIVLLALVVIVNIVLNIYLERLETQINDQLSWASLQLSAEIALNALLFTGIFQIMTREKIKWRHAIFGALLTAILWQPGRYLIATYLISDRYTPFGVVGAFWAVLLWIYYGVTVVLFGGNVVCVIGRDVQDGEPVG